MTTTAPSPEPEDHYRGWFITVWLTTGDLLLALATGRLRDGYRRPWWMAALVGVDGWLNAIGGGRRGDTISARTGRRFAIEAWLGIRSRAPRCWRAHCFWAAGFLPVYPDARKALG